MYKALSLFTLLVAAFTLTACGQQAGSVKSSDNGKINIVTTIFPPYDFARSIAGDNADITMLLPPGAECHSFEPTPRDIIRIQNCDIFIYVGGESDEWASDMLSSLDIPETKLITLMDCAEIVLEESVEGMQLEDEVIEAEYDEHIWTSPRNAKKIVQKISDALCEIDAANSEAYRVNTEDYLTKLDELDAKFQAVVDKAVRKTIVFCDRFPFRYLVDAYGLSYYAAFPGCSSETEASAATVKFLIDKINDEHIPVVFHVELGNEKMAAVISEATEARVLLLHACHNISKDDFQGGKTYLELMNANTESLKEALY